jgi:hypothetical protein
MLKLHSNKCSAATERPTPPLVEEEAPFSNMYMSKRKNNLGQKSWRDLKPRMTALLKLGVELFYNWQFTTKQFVLAQAPWDSPPDFFFFLQLNTCGRSPYVTSTLTRGWVCLLWIGFNFVKCTYRTYSMLLKILLVHYIQILCQSRLCRDHSYLMYLMLQQQLSHLNSHNLDCLQV